MQQTTTPVEAAPAGVPATAVERAASAVEAWGSIEPLPCTLSVELSITGTTIGDIVNLEPGTVIRSYHSADDPVPVWVNGVRIGHGELDVVDRRVAVRITEME